MVVLQENLQFRLSGGATNTNPFASLGGAKSANQMKDDILDALFDPISINQRLSGHTDYYCIYVHNNSSTSQMSNTKIWFTVVTSLMSMGLGTSPVGGTEQSINPDTNPPAGVNFSQPTSELNSLSIGIIPATSHKAVWFRRICPINITPTASVLTRFKCEGDNA